MESFTIFSTATVPSDTTKSRSTRHRIARTKSSTRSIPTRRSARSWPRSETSRAQSTAFRTGLARRSCGHMSRPTFTRHSAASSWSSGAETAEKRTAPEIGGGEATRSSFSGLRAGADGDRNLSRLQGGLDVLQAERHGRRPGGGSDVHRHRLRADRLRALRLRAVAGVGRRSRFDRRARGKHDSRPSRFRVRRSETRARRRGSLPSSRG